MSILEEAAELINGDRASTYGDVTENFQRIADMWTAYKGVEVPFTAYDVSNMMILVKVARLATGGYHRDSVADIAGYAGLSEQINDKATAVAGPFALALFDSVITHPPVEIKPFWDELVEAFVPVAEEIAKWFIPDYSFASTANAEPRVWQSIADVPTDVAVVDNDHDTWRFTAGFWYWSGHKAYPDLSDYDESGPFTEVLEPA